MNRACEEALFALALRKPGAERAAWLDRECGDDKDLRQRVEALLPADEMRDPLPPSDPPAVKATIKLDLAEAEDEAVGKIIGRYKVLEKVGEGGCGVVFVAEQTEAVRRRVAWKVIKLGMDTKQVASPCACASTRGKQPVDPLDQRDDQRCLSLARFCRDVWT
jgi:hypothetical protein